MKPIAKIVFTGGLALLGGLPLYALPASLSLPRGRRPGLAVLTIPQAALGAGRSGARLGGGSYGLLPAQQFRPALARLRTRLRLLPAAGLRPGGLAHPPGV
ncbi:MAG: hypothetical protein P8Z00_24860 [Anaerolineales bacterium]